MTLVGANRQRYALVFGDLDPRPSRFTSASAYGEWAKRADAWATRNAKFEAYLAQEIAYTEVMA